MKAFKWFLGLMILFITAQTIASFSGYSGSTKLGNFLDVECGTGMTCTKDRNKFKIASTSLSPFLLANDELIDNTVDDTISLQSDNNTTTVQILGFEDKGAILQLWADQGDDAADKWSLSASTDDSLSFKNSTNTLATVSPTGDWTFKGTTPYLTIGDQDAEDLGIVFDGNAVDFNISLDDSADTLVFGVGAAAGTTDAMTIDGSKNITALGDLKVEGAYGIGTHATFASGDGTPAVTGGAYFNTFTNAQIITDFIGTIFEGQKITVVSKGAITYDVTSSGLICGTTDIITATGDVVEWLYDGTDWRCTSHIDASDDQN